MTLKSWFPFNREKLGFRGTKKKAATRTAARLIKAPEIKRRFFGFMAALSF
jgi:hypothetical protein